MSKIEFKYAAARPCCGLLLDHILTDTLKLNSLTTFARAEEKTRQKIDLRTAWGMATESTGQNESGLADYEGFVQAIRQVILESQHQVAKQTSAYQLRLVGEQFCGPQRTRLIDEALARGRI